MDKGLYIQLYTIHGLVRAQNVELGRDADTGGQVTYVLDLGQALSRHPDVRQVDIVTRLIADKAVSPDYAKEIEPISPKLRIVRIPCGGGKYLRKERLWPHLDQFADRAIRFIKHQGQVPDLIHTHYADAGYVGLSLTALLGIPFVHTGHSLGHLKKQRLLDTGMSVEQIERRFAMGTRIEAEETVLSAADLVIASTTQEVEEQYATYQNKGLTNYCVIPPGIDLSKFFPYFEAAQQPEYWLHSESARRSLLEELNRFFADPNLPIILSISRPAPGKNISGLITAYGQDKSLQKIANLAIFAGIRKDISEKEENEREVLTEMLLLMDKYDLYGKLAIPKKNDFQYEVPELYRMAASRRGVFVNAALAEPFGLTLLEASACGLPIVAPSQGGPVDIVKNCENGILVDATDAKALRAALKEILSNPELWSKFSENGVREVRARYSWEAHADRYLHEIKEMYNRKSSGVFAVGKLSPTTDRLSRLSKMIVTDFDNTLSGSHEDVEQFSLWLEKHRKQVAFAIATGRSLPHLMEALPQQGRVPAPDVIIAAVGSEIYYGDRHHLDRGWAKHISYRWEPNKIKKILAQIEGIAPQDASMQLPYKLSYKLKDEARVKEIENKLHEAKLRFKLVYSHGEFLDILPYRASKGRAIRYLSYKWDIPLEGIVTCGDSGNDLDMLVGDTLGIVVGNYSDELKVLKEHRRVYFAKKPTAQGILEGLSYYHFVGEDL